MWFAWNWVLLVLSAVEGETIEDLFAGAEEAEYEHVFQLVQSGHMEGIEVTISPELYSYRLTGHPCLTARGRSLLKSLRKKGFLEKVEQYAKEKGEPLTLENFSELSAAVERRITQRSKTSAAVSAEQGTI